MSHTTDHDVEEEGGTEEEDMDHEPSVGPASVPEVHTHSPPVSPQQTVDDTTLGDSQPSIVDLHDASTVHDTSTGTQPSTSTGHPDAVTADLQPVVSDIASLEHSDSEEGLNYTGEVDSEDKNAEDKWMEAGKKGLAVMPKANKTYGTHWSKQDTDNYRTRYPDRRGHTGIKNAQFYQNKQRCQPDGMLIEDIHAEWWGDHRTLEWKHGYIQWLFPIKEQGLNWEAQELNDREIEVILGDKVAHKRILTSFKMMLDFYGIEMVQHDTGVISYKRGPKWRERFDHLNYSMHNYMRITRILKCLGEFGYEQFKAPLIKFILHEALVEGTLRRTLNSCRNYWIEVLRDDKEREEVREFDKQLRMAHL